MLNKLFRRRPLIEELEPRILFSADLAPLALDSSAPVPEQRVIHADGEFSSVALTTRNELVIVDTGVEDYETLLADILSQAGNDRHFDIVVLDAHRDGIEQITEALQQHDNLDALHLITHGDTARLQLGNGWLDAASLDTRATEIATWGDAFHADADLLLYGCDVAADAEGAAFVQRLALLTSTDVAASDDSTGTAALGGDWDLEYAAGPVESRLAFAADAPAQWQGLLEVLATTTPAIAQTNAAVAVNPVSGAFVVAWTSDYGNNGVTARVYDAAGAPLSGEIAVNVTTADDQELPAVAIANDGSFVVAWQSNNQDGDNYGIYARRFDAAGNPLSGEILVNQTLTNNQTDAAIAMAADGSFVVAWKDDRNSGDIYLRRFDNTGAALGGEILANTNTANAQLLPAIAMDGSGNFAVSWQSDSGGTGKTIFAQRFDASGAKLGGEIFVNTFDTNDQTEPAMAMTADGRFVIAWSSNNQDSGGRGVYAQRFAADGTFAGTEFRVNSHEPGHQDRAAVAMDGSGNFTIAWTSDGQDNGGSFGIYARRYFADGTADGGEFLVNTTTSGNQQGPAAAMSNAGSLIIAWDGNGVGDSQGVFWQNYVPANNPPVAVADSASTDEDSPVSVAAPGLLGNDSDPDAGAVLAVTGILPGTAGTPTLVSAGGVSVAGSYGSLLIHEDGAYTYTPNAGTAQALAAGQTVSDVFTYIITDENNANASSTLMITLSGRNDAPLAVADSGAVDANGTLDTAAAGVLGNDADVDAGDTRTVILLASGPSTAAVSPGTPGVLASAYGTLTLRADGSYTYVADGAASQALAAGETFDDVFTYTLQDAVGATSSATLSVTVSGLNDAPVAVADAQAVNEKATVSRTALAGVLSNDTDVDNGDTRTVSAVSFGAFSGTVGSELNGLFGRLTLNADGSYAYTADRPAAHALIVLQSAADVFTYTMRDAAGLTSSSTLTFNLTGSNDAPVAVADSTTAVEAGGVANGTPGTDPAGNVLANDTDVDSGDGKSVTAVSFGATPGTVGSGLAGAYGTLTLNADGSYSYVVDNDNAAVQALRSGSAPLTEVFGYTMQDTVGATSSSTLTITLTGSNDAPVAVADSATAVEAGGVANGTPGTDPAGNVLANDTDVDSGDGKSVTAVSFGVTPGTVGSGLAGAYGTLTLNADGSYSYVVDNSNAAVQALRSSSDTLAEVFGYTMQDTVGAASSSTLTLTITGSNDAPTSSPVTLAPIAEDSGARLITQVELLANAADIDDASLTATALAIAAGSGTLVDNGDGSWTYTPALNDDTAVSFSYTISDGSLSTAGSATLDITPVNDAPATGPVTLTPIAEDSGGRLITQAELLANASDVEGDSLAATALAIAAGNGTLVDNGDGSWTYTPAPNDDSAVSFSYTISDGSLTAAGTAALDITPVNDAPVITSASTTAVTEEQPASFAVSATDIDHDTLSYAISGGADAALFAIDPATGVLRLLIVPDYEMPLDANRDNVYEVIVSVSDGNGGADSHAIQMMVEDKAEAMLPTPGAGPAAAAPPDSSTPPAKEAAADTARPLPMPLIQEIGPERKAHFLAAGEPGLSVPYQSTAAAMPVQTNSGSVLPGGSPAPANALLLSLNQALGSLAGDARALQMLQTSLSNGSFQQQLDQLQETIRQQLNLDKHTVASTLAVSTGLSVGYVLWLIRGGVLLSSLLSSLPAWRLIDPLPILGHLSGRKDNDDDDESLENMLKKSNAKPAPAPTSQATEGNTP